MELTEFVTARLDEDKQEAQLAEAVIPDEDGWYVVPQLAAADPEWLENYGRAYSHIARHDPARMLVQVAAMRAIVDLHPEMLGFCQGCASERFPCRTLRHLAAIWRDHDDYDPAWAVE